MDPAHHCRPARASGRYRVGVAASVELTVVVAHPALAGSFCGAVVERVLLEAESLRADVVVQDLYADGFDPVLTAQEAVAVDRGERPAAGDELVATYQRRLADTDVLVVVHPNWWGKPPALMSGWLDRVLAPGVAYKLTGGAAGTPTSLLQLAALVVTTGDTPAEREAAVFGDPLAAIWERCVLPYVGADPGARVHISPVHGVPADVLGERLDEVAELVRKMLIR